ncbi:hypothetical protein DFH07DRAFT_828909 [Mycena maculata]|uniref:Uncharacterized protein n=1 Tax=Mycena maculata TaxID=230809 RepID=A0AAD7ISH4_9AGAR|nr:hypothetical protein DFH07DRAFT_828909 [Mycena maculata]
MVHLAQELVDAIVDDLVARSCSTFFLGALSLTATAFSDSCRRYLFRSMCLSDSIDFERTFHLLAASPYLGLYFREVEVVLVPSPSANLPLGHILLALPNVERLVWNAESIQWQEIPAPVTAAFSQIVGLPSLRHLQFSHDVRTPLPSSVLVHSISSISLRKLVLVVGAIDGDDNYLDMPSPTLPTSHITYLGLHGRDAIYPLLLHPSILAHSSFNILACPSISWPPKRSSTLLMPHHLLFCILSSMVQIGLVKGSRACLSSAFCLCKSTEIRTISNTWNVWCSISPAARPPSKGSPSTSDSNTGTSTIAH